MSPNSNESKIFIGTAGWTIPAPQKDFFPNEGSHLARYSQLLNCVEINSAFYREHKPETYAKWAHSTPDCFRFSVKLLRYFTQEKRLRETGPRLKEIIDGMKELQNKWGVLLIQLPPSLEFNSLVVEKFLKDLRKLYSGLLAWEPRHPSWKEISAIELLAAYEAHKVLADPEPVFLKRSQRAPIEKKLVYYRLHGTPEIYKSKYEPERIEKLKQRLQSAQSEGKAAWCIFDNTTFGYATENALELKEKVLGSTKSNRPGELSLSC